MGKDATLQFDSFEPLENQTLDSAPVKDRVIGTVGNVAHNVKEKANLAIEGVKEKAHDAAETIKWQAGEVREGLHRRLSVDHSAVIVAPELSPIPEEPPTPLRKDGSVASAAAETPSPLPRSEDFNNISPVERPRTTDLPQTTDLPHEKIAVISGMQVEEGSARPPITFYEKLSAAQRAWEESAHNARLKIDATLEKQFGGHADKIQAELEKARVGAISGTARIAELLQAKFRQAATLMREPRQPAPTFVPDATRQSGVLPLTPHPSAIGAQAVGGVSGPPEIKQPLDVIPHSLRADADADLENQLGEEKAMRNLARGESMRDRSVSESARVAQLFQDKLGKVASTLRDQQQHGLPPVYR